MQEKQLILVQSDMYEANFESMNCCLNNFSSPTVLSSGDNEFQLEIKRLVGCLTVNFVSW